MRCPNCGSNDINDIEDPNSHRPPCFRASDGAKLLRCRECELLFWESKKPIAKDKPTMKACSNCNWSGPAENPSLMECRSELPELIDDNRILDRSNAHGVWPIVRRTDWCGHWMAIEEE